MLVGTCPRKWGELRAADHAVDMAGAEAAAAAATAAGVGAGPDMGIIAGLAGLTCLGKLG